MSTIFQIQIASPVGELLAKSTSEAIVSLDFVECDKTFVQASNTHLELLRAQLDEYFAGKRRVFDLPLDPYGTKFQKDVWQALQTIPYGETICYSEEAKMLGRPTAYRAVANANGANPTSIIIPCHRVVAKDGSIGGYSGGIWRKEYLLTLEAKYR